jgi:dTDP-4-dehydrorhamnose reductase
LVEKAKLLGAAIIHYSPEYVFTDPKKPLNTESDKPGHQNTYCKTKLPGKQAIQAVGVPHLIVRMTGYTERVLFSS